MSVNVFLKKLLKLIVSNNLFESILKYSAKSFFKSYIYKKQMFTGLRQINGYDIILTLKLQRKQEYKKKLIIKNYVDMYRYQSKFIFILSQVSFSIFFTISVNAVLIYTIFHIVLLSFNGVHQNIFMARKLHKNKPTSEKLSM